MKIIYFIFRPQGELTANQEVDFRSRPASVVFSMANPVPTNMFEITGDSQNDVKINSRRASAVFSVSNQIPNNLPEIISDAPRENEIHSTYNLQGTLNEIDVTKLDSLIQTLDTIQEDRFLEEEMTEPSSKETNSHILRQLLLYQSLSAIKF